MGLLETAEGLLAVPSENPPGDEAAAVAWVRDRLETAAIDWTITTQPVVDGRANIIARSGRAERTPGRRPRGRGAVAHPAVHTDRP